MEKSRREEDSRAICLILLEPYHCGAPGEAGAEGVEKHNVTATNAALSSGLIQSDWDGSCRSVAVSFEIDHDLRHGNIETFGQGSNDSEIGLVRNDQRDVLDADSSLVQGLTADFLHGAHRNFEPLFPVHRNGMLVVLDGLGGRGFE